jgi:pimeloyl-ACP methyl ester carboxylesterase
MKSQWKDDRIEVNGLDIHYHRTGGDKPPIVLSHGATDNGLCWQQVAEELATAYDLIMYDARGHGLTKITSEQSGDMVEDLAHFIQSLKLTQPRLMGHSMGAATTMTLAAQYPALTRCIVLEEPPLNALFSETPEAERRANIEEWRQRMLETKQRPRERIIAQGHEEYPDWAAVEWGPWADAKLQVDPDVLLASLQTERPPWQEILKEIQCPVLIIYGEQDLGSMVSNTEAQEAQRLLGDRGEVVQVEGAGHNVRREQFQTFMNIVTRFLKSGSLS